jgi:expansin (peptidoglycan-binding protein)
LVFWYFSILDFLRRRLVGVIKLYRLGGTSVALAGALALGCGTDTASSGGNPTGGPGACETELCGGTSNCGSDPKAHTGEATYYDFADGSGNCSFDPSPGDLMIGAMNHTDYAESAACGACVLLQGPNAEILVRIVDQCPECAPGDIDLSPEAFAKIADLSAGRVPITWHYTACNVEGPIRYHWKEGSNQWWTAVQIRNHRYPIASVEYKADDGSYRSVARESYNYFIEPNGMGPGPYLLRVTDVFGQTLEDTGVAFVEAGDSPGAGQFPACVK